MSSVAPGGDELLTEYEAFRAMRLFVLRFVGEAGDDLATLLADTVLEPDGMPLDPAAWGDWRASVERAKRGEEDW